MSDKQCTNTQPHYRHTNGHTHDFCPGLDPEFVGPVRIMFDHQDKSVVLYAARIWRDPMGRLVSLEDFEGRRWSLYKMLWWKPNEAVAIEPRSPDDANIHAIHVVSEDR